MKAKTKDRRPIRYTPSPEPGIYDMYRRKPRRVLVARTSKKLIADAG